MSTENSLQSLFGVRKPIIGNIHCLPLPGAPAYERGGMVRALERAVEDALMMAEGGIDGIIIENAGDIPYARPENIGHETVAALTAIMAEISRVVQVPLGVICVANGVLPSVAIAVATGAKFVRANLWAHAYVGVEGIMNGCAAEALRYRANLHAADIAVLADVHVKFGAHALTGDRSIADLAADVEFAGADVLVASGTRTGQATTIEEVRSVKAGTSREVIVGSGLDADNASRLLEVADGAIVGSWLKETGHWTGRVSSERVKTLMKVVAACR